MTTLQNHLASLKQRLVRMSLACGAGWSILAAIGVLILWMWLDLMVELPPAVRMIANGTALLAAIHVAGRVGMAALQQIRPIELGKKLDEAAQAHGQILSGVDLSLDTRRESTAVAVGLRQLAIERAEQWAARVASTRVLTNEPINRMLMALVGTLVFIGAVFIASPRMAKTQIARFADPFGDHPPFSAISFDVNPGDASVVYGNNLDLHVTPRGGVVENLEIVVKPEDAPEEALPMFPDAGGAWLATMTNVTSPAKYFVRARGARSSKYNVSVVTVPKITEARFRITPPAYTHRPAYEGPLPQGGIAGLPGTRVQMWLKSNRPLSGGEIRIGGKKSSNAPVALTTASQEGQEVTGGFTITAAGSLAASVVDTAGQRSNESFTAPIMLLPDERPFVRVMEPKQSSFATPSVTVPVQLLAEDDYGVSRVALYRGLNELRTTPQEMPVPENQPTRVPDETQLKFADYGLKPGDVVKLYARVEDNDPAGAKGSESPIATIHIISEDEMARLQLAEQGMEVLQSKYEQASRRIEAIDKQIQELQKELENLDPNSELAKEDRAQIEKLADDMDQQADAIDKAAHQDLPFDLDRKFREKLDAMSGDVRDAAKDAHKLAGIPHMSATDAKRSLEAMREKLGTKKEDFNEQVNQPIDFLARIYPLIEDEGRFIELYQLQRELEQRMQSLRGSDQKDDPQLKSRMRDLEDEQAKVHEDLRGLLFDIENHAALLQDDPKLYPLRESANKFVEACRESAVEDKMASAQASLAEFAGTPAHDSAKAAADAMEALLGKCQGTGNEAGICLKFSPSLSENLGNTIEQLLETSGLGSKPGQGMGSGGGYSARRSTLSNVGLYGHLPTRASQSRFGGNGNKPGIATNSNGSRDDANNPALGPSDASNTVGESAASVPPQYRARVGEYFRRVADELGEQKR